jgi:hypothetical protein
MTEYENHKKIIDWLLGGDVSIQYQTYRDLLDENRPELQGRILTEGWGADFLNPRNKDMHWGKGFYQPKWTFTQYTLLDLRNLCLPQNCQPVRETIAKLLKEEKGRDGGLNPSGTINPKFSCRAEFAQWADENPVLSGLTLTKPPYIGGFRHLAIENLI